MKEMTHCIKLFNLSDKERRDICHRMHSYRTHYNIKMTVLKNVIYVHIPHEHPYQGIFNIIGYLYKYGKLTATPSNLEWFNIYNLYK